MSIKKTISKNIQKENEYKEKIKHAIESLIVATIIGIVLIAVGSGVFFGYCRPFENFVYIECTPANGGFKQIDHDTGIIEYEINGIKYEKTIKIPPRSSQGVSFYYNAENPNEIIAGGREILMIAMPIVAAVGVFMIMVGIKFYKSETKKTQTKNKKLLEKLKIN